MRQPAVAVAVLGIDFADIHLETVVAVATDQIAAVAVEMSDVADTVVALSVVSVVATIETSLGFVVAKIDILDLVVAERPLALC